MKATLLGIRGFLLVTCVTAILSTAHAKAPDIYRYRGQDAVAYYYNVDPSGCEISYAFVQIWQDSTETPPKLSGQPAFVFMEVGTSDICRGLSFSRATSPGGVPLPEGAAQISPSSKSASLNATLDLVDPEYPDSGVISTANVSIVWAATGEVQRQTHHDFRKTQSEILHIYTRGVGRDSNVSGSIVVDGAHITDSVGWGPAWIEHQVEGIIRISKLH